MNFVCWTVADRTLIVLLHGHWISAPVVLLIRRVDKARRHSILHLLRHLSSSLLIHLKGILVTKVNHLPFVLHFVVVLINIIILSELALDFYFKFTDLYSVVPDQSHCIRLPQVNQRIGIVPSLSPLDEQVGDDLAR